MVNMIVRGIGLSQQEAQLRPLPEVETTTMELVGTTNGKLFVKIDDVDPNEPNAIGLIFNGEQVDIRENETYMGTDTTDGSGAYAFDVPMRFVEGAPKPVKFTMAFILGTIEDEEMIIDEITEDYILTITQDEAKPGTYVED